VSDQPSDKGLEIFLDPEQPELPFPAHNVTFKVHDKLRYEKEALATASNQFHLSSITPNMIHATLGLTTEANEIADHLKAVLFYGKPLDKVNLIEEIGDLFWFSALLLQEINYLYDLDTDQSHKDITFADIMQKNLAKLKVRFPDKFTEFDALNRDLSSERNVLEK
jgi:NTP pyrophosphatase (non-canonical NTP hydrolase)